MRVGPYTEVLAHMVKTYKFHGREEFEPILGRWLAETVESASWRDELEAVVSVPAYWTSRLTGSFHAAERIGAAVATRLGLSHVSLLRRVRGGPSQIGLTYTQRLQNVKDAFRVRRGTRMVSARLLLVDDVRTTGATLAECARVLRRAGAKKVYAAAVVSADTLRTGMIAATRA